MRSEQRGLQHTTAAAARNNPSLQIDRRLAGRARPGMSRRYTAFRCLVGRSCYSLLLVGDKQKSGFGKLGGGELAMEWSRRSPDDADAKKVHG